MKTKGKEFKDRAAFDAALAASHGPEIVNLDGQTVRGGVLPALEFRTQQNGHIVLEEKETAPA